jgi:hypothetical protein
MKSKGGEERDIDIAVMERKMISGAKDIAHGQSRTVMKRATTTIHEET